MSATYKILPISLVLPAKANASKTSNGREEFESEIRLPEGSHYDFGNGLTALAISDSAGYGFYTLNDHGVPDPGWGKRCLVVSGGAVYFYFDSLVSRVSFSYANVESENSGLNFYMYQERGGDFADTIPLPATGGPGSPPKELSLISERGIEYVAIGGREPRPMLLIDNLKWVTK